MCLAVPGKIISIKESDDPLERTGVVDFEGVRRQVGLAWVPEADVGDYVIVHVGHAISRLDPDEAQRTLETFRQLSQVLGPADSEK
ncbi:MAG TPA: HypC/HybG/HupF family hydrogenase formation chaperone [Kiritimatiellae bacterium]|nr:HypC/HybG/HupF family hydrogenase formation chaperone [Kiritimatiellia bacterium]